jgi:hypothetical protein
VFEIARAHTWLLRSLAAYGIDPGQAVAAENPEDGGVEEDDDEEEEDSEDDEDVQFVLSGQASRLDLRWVHIRISSPLSLHRDTAEQRL